MKVLLIGASHGNEILGVAVYQRLLSLRSEVLEHVDFLIGNPRAYRKNIRYIDTDLNRSYQTGTANTYEKSRAEYVSDYIHMTRPDLVIDVHTTNCSQPISIIVSNLDGKQKKKFLRATHVPNIVQVKPLADITTIYQETVAYEVSNNDIDDSLIDSIVFDIKRYVEGVVYEQSKQLYVISDKIYKSKVTKRQASTLKNFEMHPLGYVPILTGENSYSSQTDYIGFKASAVQSIEV